MRRVRPRRRELEGGRHGQARVDSDLVRPMTEASATHSDELAEFGYKQELDRSIGKFASFAAGVSYISILTGTFQLFFFGFATGGPAYWWSWPMVFAGQLMVALTFAELAANIPVAGSVYKWSKRLGVGGGPAGRLAGRVDDADRLRGDDVGGGDRQSVRAAADLVRLPVHRGRDRD